MRKGGRELRAVGRFKKDFERVLFVEFLESIPATVVGVCARLSLGAAFIAPPTTTARTDPAADPAAPADARQVTLHKQNKKTQDKMY